MIKKNAVIIYLGNIKKENASTQRIKAIQECLNKNFFTKIFDVKVAKISLPCKYKVPRFILRYRDFIKSLKKYIVTNKIQYVLLYNQDPVLLIFLFIYSKVKQFGFAIQICEKHLWSDYYYKLNSIHYFLEKLFFLFLSILECKKIVISKFLQKKFSADNFFLPGIIPKAKIVLRESSYYKPFILYIGRGDYRDDIYTMVEAFIEALGTTKITKTRFYMVGLTKEVQKKTQELASLKKIKNIHCLGFISKTNLCRIERKSGIFLFCRRFNSSVDASFPTRVAEMLLKGKTIITTPHSTLYHYAKITRKVRIIPSHNISLAANALIQELVKKSRPCKRSYSYFKKTFDPNTYSDELYQYLIK